MKTRIIITLIAAATMSVSVKASDMNLVAGDVDALLAEGNTATIEWDYSSLDIEGKPYMEFLNDKGSDYLRDWPAECKRSEDKFAEKWNTNNSKGMQIVEGNTEGAQYRMVIKPTYLTYGSTGASVVVGFGAGGAAMDCSITIYESGKDNSVAEISIKRQTGKSKFSEGARRENLYHELADDVLKYIKKLNKKKK